MMSGELRDDSVFIESQKESSRLYTRGNYGYPLRGGGLELDLMEALYLVETKRLEVMNEGQVMTFEELFNHASSVMENFDIVYLVYRGIKSRGLVVKAETGTFDLAVFPRGRNMSNSRPEYMVRAVSERTAFDIATYTGEVSETENRGKELLYGVVDEEGDVTYYKMSRCDPRGTVLPGEKIERTQGRLIRDRIFVFDPADSLILRESGYYGKMIENVLQLSLIEACYLVKRKEISVYSSQTGKKIPLSALKEFGRKTQDEFDLRLKAYTDARSRGLVVKTGFKYGTHFRAYEGSPDDTHARYLIHTVDASNKTMWPEISRAVRLSGGVKKEFLFCRIGETVEYLEFKWFKP